MARGDRYRAVKHVNEALRQRKIAFINEYKMERGCQDPDCGWTGEFTPQMLDLNHLVPEEKNPVCRQVAFYHLGWEALLVEMDKCEVLCSNCHRKLTYEQKQQSKKEA